MPRNQRKRLKSSVSDSDSDDDDDDDDNDDSSDSESDNAAGKYYTNKPDSLPVLGTIKRHPGVVLATGHGQSGLALAAITAKLVGALVRGEPAEVDMAPYRVDRFGDAAASSGNSIEEQRDDHR